VSAKTEHYWKTLIMSLGKGNRSKRLWTGKKERKTVSMRSGKKIGEKEENYQRHPQQTDENRNFFSH